MRVHRDVHGYVRVITAHVSYERLVERAFEKIRQAGRGMPAVLIRQLEGLAKIMEYVQRAEQRDLLDRLLVELDEQDRAMLVMKEVAGFTVDEIGDILELNANTVKVRLFRARGRLVEIFRRRLKTLPAKPSARRKLGDN